MPLALASGANRVLPRCPGSLSGYCCGHSGPRGGNKNFKQFNTGSASIQTFFWLGWDAKIAHEPYPIKVKTFFHKVTHMSIQPLCQDRTSEAEDGDATSQKKACLNHLKSLFFGHNCYESARIFASCFPQVVETEVRRLAAQETSLRVSFSATG